MVGRVGGRVVLSAALVSLLAIALPARADETRPVAETVRAGEAPKRPWLLTLDPSLYIAGGQMEGGGPDRSVPPPLYLGLTLERTLRGPLEVSVSAGGAASLGWLLGAAVRYAGPPPSDTTHVSVGVGPEIVTGGGLGTGALVQGDVSIEKRFKSGFALAFGPRVAVAVTHAGVPGCGVDTCNASMKPGDIVVTLRSGLGFTF
jgi:hypothetical protein